MTRAACWILGWLVLAGCRVGGGTPEPAKSGRLPEPGLQLERAEFSEASRGGQLWRVQARRATYRARGGVAVLEGIQATFFEAGRPVTRGGAPQATFDQPRHDLRLAGGLRLETLDGKAGVQAEEARWDPASGRLDTGGGVAFWQGPNRLTANRLWADRSLRRVELRGRVRGALRLGPREGAWR